MRDDVVFLGNFFHYLRDLIYRCFSVDRKERIQICALHADLELYKSRTHALKDLDFFFAQKVGRDLKMEIRDVVVVFRDETPDRLRTIVVAVECAVDKLHLRHLLIEKKLQFAEYERKASEAGCLVNGGQAVTAVEWASSGRFVIHDPVFEFVDPVLINEGERIHVDTDLFLTLFLILFFVCSALDGNSGYVGKIRSIGIIHIRADNACKRCVTFADDDSRDTWMISKKSLKIVGNFRPSEPDICFRKELRKLVEETFNDLYIPYICRKTDGSRMMIVDTCQNIIEMVIDRVFRDRCDFRIDTVSIGLKRINCRI